MTITIIAIASMVIPLLVTAWLAWQRITGHRWEYRNPYTRTCTSCDRQEDWHCWAEYAHRPAGSALYGDRGWWEEMRPGSGSRCRREAA